MPSVSFESVNRNLKRVSVEAATDTSPSFLPSRPLRIELHGVYSVSLVRTRSCGEGGRGCMTGRRDQTIHKRVTVVTWLYGVERKFWFLSRVESAEHQDLDGLSLVRAVVQRGDFREAELLRSPRRRGCEA